MTDKKSFLRKLFSQGNKIGSTESSSSSELASVLHSEFGISVMQNSLSIDELIRKGYQKVDSHCSAQIDSLLQYIPQFVAMSAQNAADKIAFDKAVVNTYRVVLKKGGELVQSRKSPGALRAFVRNKSITENAELFKNDAVFSSTSAPQIALGVFTAISMITGQYFMAEINGKLKEMEESIDRIERYLDVERQSKLKAAYQELEDIKALLPALSDDANRMQAALNQLHSIQRTAREQMNICRDTIAAELSSVKANDSEDTIKRKIDIIGKFLCEYQQAVQLFGYSKLFEILVCNEKRAESLKQYRDSISECISLYKQDRSHASIELYSYVNASDALNKPSLVESIITFLPDAIISGVGGYKAAPQNATASGLLDEILFAKGRQKRKEEKIFATKNLFSQLDDSPLTAAATSLDNYISTMEHPIELVCLDGEYYTNLQQTGTP